MSIIGEGSGIASSGGTVYVPVNLLYSGSQVSFPETQRPGRDVDHTPPICDWAELHLCSPLCAFVACCRVSYTLTKLYVLLAVHLGVILVNDQLDAQFFFLICLFQSSTCFEQPRAHHQENQLYQYNFWYMSLCLVCRLKSSFPTCILDGHLHRVAEVVLIQLILLMMSTRLLESYRGLK
jgi:hypothetical protein